MMTLALGYGQRVAHASAASDLLPALLALYVAATFRLIHLLQGKLFVSFEVVFPKNGQINEASAKMLVQVLTLATPPSESVMVSECRALLMVCCFEGALKCLIWQALPAAPPLPKHDDAEEVTMTDADLSSMGQNAHGRGGAYEEDDEEDGRGGQRVQCAQQ